MKDIFPIQFLYHGLRYSGMVKPGERENDLSYLVSFGSPPGKIFDQTIELRESATDDTGNFEWTQKVDEAGQTGADPAFIQIIGEAIENSD